MRLSRPVQPSRLPHIEVVVPCYNYGRFLPGCVESIVGQAGVTTTVTIVNDASTDDSGEIADRLADQHANVKVLHNNPNLGMIGTFNRGLAQVDSDYLLLISADDLVAPGALGRACGLMEANPGVGLVYGRVQKFATEPVARRPLPTETWSTWKGDDWIDMQLRRAWNNISSPEAVVRTSVQHAVGYYDPGLRHTLDVEMWLRIAAVSDVGHVNGVDQAYYRRQAGSYSTQFSFLQDIEERWKAYDQFLTNWANHADAARLRPIVRRRLADEALFDLLVVAEHGGADRDTIDSALEIASRIDSTVTERGQWADVRTLRAGGAPSGGRSLLREAARRAKWQRWHRFRYFG